LSTELIKEVKCKLDEKENQEDKYVKKYLKEYEDYVSVDNLFRTPDEDEMHGNSQVIIEQFKRTNRAKGKVVAGKKGGIGKARLFSNFAFIADTSSQLDIDYSLQNKAETVVLSSTEQFLEDFAVKSKEQQRIHLGKTTSKSAAVSPPDIRNVESNVSVAHTSANDLLSSYAQPRVVSRDNFASMEKLKGKNIRVSNKVS
jgi:hypothetical protein